MKKILPLLLGLLSLCYMASAQFSEINHSDRFDEPEDGYAKLLCLSNTHTAFIHFKLNGKVVFRLLDANFKLIAEQQADASFDDLKSHNITAMNDVAILGFFENKAGVNAIITSVKKDDIVLTRMVFDKNDGHLIADEQLQTVPRQKTEVVMIWNVYAKKDELLDKLLMPVSNYKLIRHRDGKHYTLISYNSKNENDDPNQDTYIMQFDENNQRIHDTHLKIAEKNIRKAGVLDACETEDNLIVLLLKCSSAASPKSKTTSKAAYLAPITFDNTPTTLENINYTGAKNLKDAKMYFNPATKQYLIFSKKELTPDAKGKPFAASKVNETIRPQIYKTIYNTASKQSQTTMLSSPALSSIASRKYHKQGALSLLPCLVSFSSNGDYRVIYEEYYLRYSQYSTNKTITSNNSGLSARSGSSSSTRVKIHKGDIGIVDYLADNTEKSAMYIPKDYIIFNQMELNSYDYLYGAVSEMKRGSGLKSFFYLESNDKSMIVFNDEIANAARVAEGKKVKTITGTEDCIGYFADLSGNNEMPVRQAVFSGDDKRPVGIFSASDYDPERHVFITLKLDKAHPNKGVQVIGYKMD